MSGQNPANSTTIHDLHPDVITRTLRLLDGPTLAAASSASSHLHSLSSQSDLWLRLSLSTFPSLHNPLILPFLSTSPKSFFSDVFPFPESFSSSTAGAGESLLSDELISAVDIHHRNNHIFSRVIRTETSSPWFRGSPFLIGAMDNQKTEQTLPRAMISPEELTLSWILIDPSLNRAVNVSPRRPVAIERNCYTGETMVRFATASAGGEKVIGAVVTCGEADGQIRDAMLTAEDIDGACLSGNEALRIVRGMMDSRRRGGGGRWEEEAKERFLEFLRWKKRRKESRARREGVLDLCCTAVGVVVFLAFLSFLLFR